jgi:capsular exopolysaccharide synthesis family protein
MKLNSPSAVDAAAVPSGNLEPEVDLRDYLLALRRRWLVILLVGLATFVAAAFMSVRQRRVYSSTAKIVVARKAGDVQVGSILSGPAAFQGGSPETQVQIINSPDTLRRAFERLPALDRQKGFMSSSPPSWAYDIRVLPDTDVIIIDAKAYHPRVAADLANNIADSYLAQDLKRNNQATRQRREYVEHERDNTFKELRRATDELADFKKETKLFAIATQASDAATNKSRLQSDLAQARSALTAANQGLSALKRELASTNAEVDFQKVVAENPEYALLRTKVVDLQNKLADVSQEYAPGSPERAQVEKPLADLERQMKALSKNSVASSTRQRNPVLDDLLGRYASTRVDVLSAAARVAALEAQAADVEKELSLFPDRERRFNELQQRVDVLKETYDLLSQRYYSLLIEERGTVPGAQIVASAQPSSKPTSPNIPRNLTIGFILAAFFGVCAGLLADYFDNKMHRPEDVERYSGATTLSLIPEAESANGEDTNLYIGKASPVHSFMESFRMLRNNISFVMPDRKLSAFAVTSSSMGEGKSTVSANIAIAMAMDRKRVLLVDCDLRKPTVHTKMKVSKDVGLTNVVRGFVSLEEAIQPTEWVGLDCLSAGPLPPDPTEFLNSERTHQVIQEARERYDVVILDSPPCIGLSDMQVISKLVDGVLLVVALERAPKQQLMATMRMLTQAGARVLGTAINRVGPTSQGYYGYYGYYGYGGYGGYGEDTSENGKSKKRSKISRR